MYMPMRFTDYHASYEPLKGDGGLYIGRVLRLGDGYWLVVCPICGCGHDVYQHIKLEKGDVYQPHCYLKTTHKKIYQDWLDRFPESLGQTQVELRLIRQPIVIAPYEETKPKEIRKSKRKAA